MNYQANHDKFEVTTEPVKILIISEPYVIYTGFGYQAVVDVQSTKKK